MAERTSPEITVVIPVYNEEGIVEEAATALAAGLEARGIDYEILLSENGSTDRTRELLAALAEGNPRIRFLTSGLPDYGAALRRGIMAAEGELVVCDEIDLCDLDFYDRALPLLRDGEADFVVGSKAARGALDRRPFVRRLGTRVINELLHLSLGFTGTDTHGLKAFRRSRVLPVVEKCVVSRDLFASELVIRAERMGVRLLEIPIELEEKRPPSIHLARRVPGVLGNLGRLVWVIRIRGE